MLDVCPSYDMNVLVVSIVVISLGLVINIRHQISNRVPRVILSFSTRQARSRGTITTLYN
jgi:hypothetical protein